MNENDPGAAFAAMAGAHDAAIAVQPKGDAPVWEHPDLELFHETSRSTDRALADSFFRHYRHLFCNGDGLLRVFHGDRAMWSSENVTEQVYAYCVHLSDRYAQELARIMEAIEAVRAGRQEGDIERLTEQRQAVVKMILHCEKASTIGNVARMLMAKLKTVTAERPQRMNPDPEVLACSNGVVNLRTGELRWAQREDYLTRNTGGVYDPDADYSWWATRILEITGGNPRVAEFLQVWAGYCATGYTKEHSMAIFWGMGRNGKNVLVDSLAAALGGYARTLPQSFLESNLDVKNMDNNMIYALADLHGVRLAYASETGERGKLKEAWVKSQTGDRTLLARAPYGAFFEFPLTHKLIIGTNHKPEITGTDDGVWERVQLVPFGVRFGSQAEVDAGIAQGLMDRGLLDLSTSITGRRAVLRWIVEGARKYLANGLRRYVPVEIKAETQLYRREQDVLGQFLQDVSEWVPPGEVERVMHLEANNGGSRAFNNMTLDERLRVEKQELWRVYVIWCEEHGHKPYSATMFARRVTSAQRFWQDEFGDERLMQPLDEVRTANARFYRYIRLNDTGRLLRGKAFARQDALERRLAGKGKDDDF